MFDNILTEMRFGLPQRPSLGVQLKPSSVIESCTLSVLFLWGKGHNAPNFIHMKLIIHGPVFSHPAMVSPQPNFNRQKSILLHLRTDQSILTKQNFLHPTYYRKTESNSKTTKHRLSWWRNQNTWNQACISYPLKLQAVPHQCLHSSDVHSDAASAAPSLVFNEKPQLPPALTVLLCDVTVFASFVSGYQPKR